MTKLEKMVVEQQKSVEELNRQITDLSSLKQKSSEINDKTQIDIYEKEIQSRKSEIKDNFAHAKIVQIIKRDEFTPYKTTQGKTVAASVRKETIFTNSKELGLYNNTDFQKFFMTLCEEEVSNVKKYARLKRESFQIFL